MKKDIYKDLNKIEEIKVVKKSLNKLEKSEVVGTIKQSLTTMQEQLEKIDDIQKVEIINPQEQKEVEFPEIQKVEVTNPQEPVVIPEETTIKNTDELAEKLKKAFPPYLPPVVNIPDQVTVRNMPKYPDFPKSFRVDNLTDLLNEGNKTGKADPTKYLPVRLTNGKNFYEGMSDAYVSAAKTVFPFVNMNTGQPQPAAVDNSGVVQTNASGIGGGGGGGGVVTSVSGSQHAFVDNFPTQQHVWVDSPSASTTTSGTPDQANIVNFPTVSTVVIQSQPAPTGLTTVSGQATGVYNATAPTLTTGQVYTQQLDINANTKQTLATLIAGENLTTNRLNNEPIYSYAGIVLAAPTTSVVKSGAGTLHAIIINKAVATGVITVYDNTAGSGTVIATITQPAAVLSTSYVLLYDVSFATGLTIVTATAAQDITVAYR